MLCFDIFQVAPKGNRKLNRWHSVCFNMNRMWFFVLSVIDVERTDPNKWLPLHRESVRVCLYVYPHFNVASKSKQNLIGSFLLSKQETGSSLVWFKKIDTSTNN